MNLCQMTFSATMLHTCLACLATAGSVEKIERLCVLVFQDTILFFILNAKLFELLLLEHQWMYILFTTMNSLCWKKQHFCYDATAISFNNPKQNTQVFWKCECKFCKKRVCLAISILTKVAIFGPLFNSQLLLMENKPSFWFMPWIKSCWFIRLRKIL